MSSMPLITHRMFVAAVAQERRHEEEAREDGLPWPTGSAAAVQVLEPMDGEDAASWEWIPRRPSGSDEF